MVVKKVIYGQNTLLDLTQDTVVEDKLVRGYTAHDREGIQLTGTGEFDSDTSHDTAIAAEIAAGKTAHARGELLTGTMTNNGAVIGRITTKAQSISISQGYHNGDGNVAIATSEQNKLIPENIKKDVEILGVTGTHEGGGGGTYQSKTATPTKSTQVIEPDTGYDALSDVTVNPIPNQYQNVSNVTATSTGTLSGMVFVNSQGAEITGSMTNNGAVSQSLTYGQEYTVPEGYHNGSGKVTAPADRVLTTKSVTANGTYNASSDSADGYSSFTVAVPSPPGAYVQGTVLHIPAGSTGSVNGNTLNLT